MSSALWPSLFISETARVRWRFRSMAWNWAIAGNCLAPRSTKVRGTTAPLKLLYLYRLPIMYYKGESLISYRLLFFYERLLAILIITIRPSFALFYGIKIRTINITLISQLINVGTSVHTYLPTESEVTYLMI